MRIRLFKIERSNKYIIEKHKPIIPTIIYWSNEIGNKTMVVFKFMFWKWWFKIAFIIENK